MYLALLTCLEVQSRRENAFCILFHVRWISHHLSPNSTLGEIRRLMVRKIYLTWKPNIISCCFESSLSGDMHRVFTRDLKGPGSNSVWVAMVWT